MFMVSEMGFGLKRPMKRHYKMGDNNKLDSWVSEVCHQRYIKGAVEGAPLYLMTPILRHAKNAKRHLMTFDDIWG